MDVIPFEMDIISGEDWILSNCDNSIMHTHEGQMLLEMLRVAIKDYQLCMKGRQTLEAGAYHSTQNAGKYIHNVKWWLFEETVGSVEHSPLPFDIVCEFLGFNSDVVRRSILKMIAEKEEFNSQQAHRNRNTIKKREVAIRARDDLISEDGGNDDACRTVTREA